MNIGKIPSFSIEKPDMFKTAFSGGVQKTRLIPDEVLQQQATKPTATADKGE